MIARWRIMGLSVAALVLVTDQAVKQLMIGPLQLKSRAVIHLISFFDLRWAENRGVSMGLLTADSDAQRWALVGLTAALSIGIVVWMWREQMRAEILALGMVLGGAIGNIIDRVRFGYVVDYADLHFGVFRPFFIFNLADAAISVGVVILLYRALRPGQSKNAADPASSGPAAEVESIDG